MCNVNEVVWGQLAVRHDGTTRTLDWGRENPNAIEWAAFYSDCEHEILEVTDGHRVTLTYNLYISNNVGGVISRNPTLDVKELPLFTTVKGLLGDKDFLPSGGVLGFCCAHQYVHTNGSSTIRIPHVLKGMDMALYAVFRALGLRLDVLPVLDQGYGTEIGGIDYTGTQKVYRPYNEGQERERLEKFRHMGYSKEWEGGDFEGKRRCVGELTLKYDDSAIDPSLDFRQRLATLLYTRRIIGVESKVEKVLVGTTLSELTTTDKGGDEMDDKDSLRKEYWPHNLVSKVHWVTPPYHRELNLAHLAYGNQPALETLYTYAALLVIVPPWSQTLATTIVRGVK